jgi:hypothetical protein
VARRMYDGITASALPVGGDLYAGYVDGRWPSADAIAVRFPGKTVVRIAVSPSTDDGVVGDGPPDNSTWSAWVRWVVLRRAKGVDPTVYTNASSWDAGIQAFKDAGVAEPHWWIAHYDGIANVPAGAAAKQYATNADFDTSAVSDYWPGVDPAPKPVPPPAPQPQENIMPYLVSVTPDPTGHPGNTNAGIFSVDGGAVKHIPKTVAPYDDYHNMVARFGAPVVVSPQYYQNLLAEGIGPN